MRSGIDLIKQFEGLKLEAYLDSGGIPTIGYGETKNVHMGMVITADQAEQMLEVRYDEFESQVIALLKTPINTNQLGALVSFVYNLGASSLAHSTLLKELNAGRPKEVVAQQFLLWDKDNGKVLPGLLRRRQAEQAMFLS